MDDLLGADMEDSSQPTRIALALDGLEQQWDLLVDHFFVEGEGMCSQVMLMSDYVNISIVTNLVLYRDMTEDGDREEISYTSLTGAESLHGGSGSQLPKMSRFYSSSPKCVVYVITVGGGGCTGNLLGFLLTVSFRRI